MQCSFEVSDNEHMGAYMYLNPKCGHTHSVYINIYKYATEHDYGKIIYLYTVYRYIYTQILCTVLLSYITSMFHYRHICDCYFTNSIPHTQCVGMSSP